MNYKTHRVFGRPCICIRYIFRPRFMWLMLLLHVTYKNSAEKYTHASDPFPLLRRACSQHSGAQVLVTANELGSAINVPLRSQPDSTVMLCVFGQVMHTIINKCFYR